MNTVQFTAFEGPSSIQTVSATTPHVSNADDVLIALDAAHIGAWDLYSTFGAFVGAGGSTSFPQTLGWDFSGRVMGVGNDVTSVRVGDRVMGFSPQPWSGVGVLAERFVLSENLLTKVPQDLNTSVAATLPVSGVTAYQMAKACAPSSERVVVILGAGGGVGRLTSQLCIEAGAHVIGFGREHDRDLVSSFGAHFASTLEDLTHTLARHGAGKTIAVVDYIGQDLIKRVSEILPEGSFILSALPGQEPPAREGITVETYMCLPHPGDLAHIAEKVAQGTLKPSPIGARYDLDQTREAFVSLQSKEVQGRVVVEMAGV